MLIRRKWGRLLLVAGAPATLFLRYKFGEIYLMTAKMRARIGLRLMVDGYHDQNRHTLLQR